MFNLDGGGEGTVPGGMRGPGGGSDHIDVIARSGAEADRHRHRHDVRVVAATTTHAHRLDLARVYATMPSPRGAAHDHRRGGGFSR